MSFRKVTSLIITGLLCGNIATGCGGSESIPTIDFPQDQFRNEQVNQFYGSPLRGAIGATPERSAEFAVATMSLLEQTIATCMNDLGHEYISHLVQDDLGVVWLPAMTRAQFAERHGFGSRLTIADSTVSDLVEEDPNESILGQLSEQERESWESDLLGQDGCRVAAASSIWGPHTAEFNRLEDTSSREIQSHIGLQKSIDDYISCTADSGYDWLNNPWISREIGIETAIAEGLSKQDEVSAALVNLECMYPVELMRRSIQHSIEEELVEQEAETLSDIRASVEQMIDEYSSKS